MRRTFILTACLLFAAGCATPNLRVWHNANLKATGAIGSRGDAVYYSVCIGTDEFPYDGRQAFAIRLPSGVLLSSDDFAESTIRPIALALLKTGDSIIRHDPKRGRHRYFLEGVGFEYEGDQLVTLDISRVWFKEKGCIPAIAKTASGTFHPFPVPEKHLNEIFGPPDKTEDSFRW